MKCPKCDGTLIIEEYEGVDENDIFDPINFLVTDMEPEASIIQKTMFMKIYL